MILWVNEEVCRLVGSDDQDLVGHSLLEHLGPEANDVLGERLAAKPNPDEPVFYRGSFRSFAGNDTELAFRIYPVVELESQEFLHHVSIGADQQEAVSGDALRKTYGHTSLRFEEGERLFARAEALVQGERLYLDANISLEEVAHRLATNQLYLSQAINFFAGNSFRNYINDKRYRYLQRAAPSMPGLSVDELWRLVGFGSYSTFRRYLRQERNITPRQLLGRLRVTS